MWRDDFRNSMSSREAGKAFEDATVLKDAERIRFAVNAAGIGVWELDTTTNKVIWDDRCRELYGLAKDHVLSYEEAIRFIHPDDVAMVNDAVQSAISGQNGAAYDATYRTIGADDGLLRWVRFSGQAYFDESGSVVRFVGAAQDITGQVKNKEQAQAAQELLNAAVKSADIGIYRFDLKTGAAEYSPAFAHIVTGTEKMSGEPREAFTRHTHPDDERMRQSAMAQSMQTGTLHYEPRVIWVDGSIHRLRVSGSYLYDANGEASTLIGTVWDITEETREEEARQTAQYRLNTSLQESELFARSIIENSPVAKIVFTGEEMVINTANQNMLEMLGRDDSIIGQPVMVAMPELLGTPLMDRLRNVYTTGETYYQPEERIELVRFGKPYSGYYNYIYKALRNTAGDIYGIITTATEVTDQVNARLQLENAELKLREAIELAGLGTWTIDMATEQVYYGERVAEWFGIPSGSSLTELYHVMPAEDAAQMRAAIEQALTPGAERTIDIEHRIVHQESGRLRIIHSKGLVMADANGAITSIIGTGMDVTAQRALQTALEADIAERTEELAAANEEMQVINEELAESNDRLVHSNEELAQYAYVASHDLQEPLRKIQVFAGMLGSQKTLTPESVPLVKKISFSAGRMSLLIQDLLNFSRLLNSDTLMRPVALTELAKAVADDFELLVEEKGAIITIGELPVIDAVSLQMNQLFNNLMSNALKFTAPGIMPEIRISAARASMAEVKQFIGRPFPFAEYYHITVSDNGIGFETQYNEQIFEVFKRLHGRDTYPGSGIGLALCRRIAANHHGCLYAESSPGNGSTFHILLPDRQHDFVAGLVNDAASSR